MISGGLPVILILLNGAPVLAIVDTRAELSIVSLKVVNWAWLPKIDCARPLLLIVESADV